MIIKTLSLSELKDFAKNYRVPMIATAVFLIVATSLLWLRINEKMALADLFSRNSALGQYYSALLSRDKNDDFYKNNTNSDGPSGSRRSGAQSQESATTEQNSTDPTSPTPPASPSPTSPSAITPSGSPPPSPTPTPNPAPSPNPTPTPNPNFSAWIHLFQVAATSSVICSNGSTSGTDCYKIYRVDPVIRTSSGPGTVNYSIIFSIPGSKNGSFAAGPGEDYHYSAYDMPVPCDGPSQFTAQLKILSPVQSSSGVLTISNQC